MTEDVKISLDEVLRNLNKREDFLASINNLVMSKTSLESRSALHRSDVKGVAETYDVDVPFINSIVKSIIADNLQEGIDDLGQLIDVLELIKENSNNEATD